MAITTTREQRRIENHERALAAYMEHHAAVLALITLIVRSRSRTTTSRPIRSRSTGAPSARCRPLETVTGVGFSASVHRDSLVFTPASTGIGRSDELKAAARFLDRYNTTRSLRPGDYADITRNGSYLVGLLMVAGR